jgi:hypothetical protein
VMCAAAARARHIHGNHSVPPTPLRCALCHELILVAIVLRYVDPCAVKKP